MDISKNDRENIIKKLSTKFSKQIAEDIEESIYSFSKEYAETNDTPYLLDSIYSNKSEEIIDYLSNKNSKYLIDAIKEKKIDAKKIAYAKPDELDPEKYSEFIKLRQISEYKKNNANRSNVFTCPKCKKAECEVSQKQTRSGDEPPTTFVKCLVCGHVMKF